jgi:hypothetical protein
MRDLILLFVHVIATLARFLGSGSLRSVVAESVRASGHLICLLQIALWPVCVLSSSAPPA